MKWKWIFTVCLIFIIIIGIFSYFYIAIRQPMTLDNIRAIEYVMKETVIEEVNDITFYNGSNHYQVITGTDAKGEQWVVWYNEENDEVIKRKMNEGLSEKEVLQIVNQRLKVKKIENIRLGIENNLPVYEVTYIDDEDRYAYYYLTFNDGTFVKRYSLKRD